MSFPFSRVKCYWSLSSTKDQKQDEVSKPDAPRMERWGAGTRWSVCTACWRVNGIPAQEVLVLKSLFLSHWHNASQWTLSHKAKAVSVSVQLNLHSSMIHSIRNASLYISTLGGLYPMVEKNGSVLKSNCYFSQRTRVWSPAPMWVAHNWL